MRLRRALIVIGAVTMAAAQLHAGGQQGAPSEGRVQRGTRLKIERDLEYAKVAGKPMLLEIYRPNRVTAPTPVIVWIHGTRGGDPPGQPHPRWRSPPPATLSPVSITVATPTRRLPRASATPKPRFAGCARTPRVSTSTPPRSACLGMSPAQPLRRFWALPEKNPRWKAMAARLARENSRVQAVCALAGTVDRAQRVNPLAFVTKDDAPTLILHGSADAVVPTLQSQALVSALKVAGVDATLDLQIGVTHELNRLLTPLAMQQVNGFFDQMLRGARRAAGTSTLLVHAAHRIRRSGRVRLRRLSFIRPIRHRCAAQGPLRATVCICRPTTTVLRPGAIR